MEKPIMTATYSLINNLEVVIRTYTDSNFQKEKYYITDFHVTKNKQQNPLDYHDEFYRPIINIMKSKGLEERIYYKRYNFDTMLNHHQNFCNTLIQDIAKISLMIKQWI